MSYKIVERDSGSTIRGNFNTMQEAKTYADRYGLGYYRIVKTVADRRNYTLRRVRLDRGGYDERGKYYGVGQLLYEASNKNTNDYTEFRAADKADAEDKLAAWIAKGH